VEKNFPDNEAKKCEVLEGLTRGLVGNEKYKQDERYIRKWTTYAEFCSDPEEILKYMEENHIGTEVALFYKAYCVVYERQRKFSKANDMLLLGKKKGAKPAEKMAAFIKSFEARMTERLERDFYSQGKRIDPNDFVEIPVVYSDETEDSSMLSFTDRYDSNSKRKFPFGAEGYKPKKKKVKLVDLINSLNMGEFNIYVDPECTPVIPQSTILVNQYDALCLKYKFTLEPAVIQKNHQSWISQQIGKMGLNTSLNQSSMFLV